MNVPVVLGVLLLVLAAGIVGGVVVHLWYRSRSAVRSSVRNAELSRSLSGVRARVASLEAQRERLEHLLADEITIRAELMWAVRALERVESESLESHPNMSPIPPFRDRLQAIPITRSRRGQSRDPWPGRAGPGATRWRDRARRSVAGPGDPPPGGVRA